MNLCVGHIKQKAEYGNKNYLLFLKTSKLGNENLASFNGTIV
jgi:hypothetical protein